MNDLISKADVCEIIADVFPTDGELVVEVKEVMKAYDAIIALSYVQPEKRWVPCSERLPDKSGRYCVSGGDKVWICEFLTIPNFTSGWCNDVSNPVVQAWMPLPESYRGAE